MKKISDRILTKIYPWNSKKEASYNMKNCTLVWLLLDTQYKIKKSTALVFFAAILVQVFHMLEHFAQIHQHAILGLSIKDSVGLLPFLNLEYVHWIYNLAYLILLGIVFKECRFFTLKDRTDSQKIAIILFGLGFFLQGYHVIEHTVRVSQYHITGWFHVWEFWVRTLMAFICILSLIFWFLSILLEHFLCLDFIKKYCKKSNEVSWYQQSQKPIFHNITIHV